MEKPITIRQEELTQKIVETINSSELHPALVEPIVKDIYQSVCVALAQQKEKERAEYENSLVNEKGEEPWD